MSICDLNQVGCLLKTAASMDGDPQVRGTFELQELVAANRSIHLNQADSNRPNPPERVLVPAA